MLATAQFWCADQLSNALVTTRAPSSSAIVRVRSVLIESRTTISSHQESDSRHSRILISSFRVRIRTETLTQPHCRASPLYSLHALIAFFVAYVRTILRYRRHFDEPADRRILVLRDKSCGIVTAPH